MISIKIDITDKASPELRQILQDVRPGGGLGMVMGRALGNTLKKHFRSRNAKPNKLRGVRTNFWSAVAQSVQEPVAGNAEISVSVIHPAIAQKYSGGRISPKKKKALAIPVNAKAHGKSPRLFTNLAFIPAPKGTTGNVGYLVEGELRKITRGENKGKDAIRPKKGGAMMYVLRSWVDQKADKQTLPPATLMVDDILRAARIFMNRPKAG